MDYQCYVLLHILPLSTSVKMGNIATAARIGQIVIPAVFSGWVVREANLHISKESEE